MQTLEKEVEKVLKDYFWENIDIDFHDEKWDGKHFMLFIISEIFEWKSRVERSQEVYKLLDVFMKTGSIHALRMKLKSPTEIL